MAGITTLVMSATEEFLKAPAQSFVLSVVTGSYDHWYLDPKTRDPKTR